MVSTYNKASLFPKLPNTSPHWVLLSEITMCWRQRHSPGCPAEAWAVFPSPLCLPGALSSPGTSPLLAEPACGRTRTSCHPWVPTASTPLETSQKEHGNCLQGRQDSSLSWDDTPGTPTPEKGPRTTRLPLQLPWLTGLPQVPSVRAAGLAAPSSSKWAPQEKGEGGRGRCPGQQNQESGKLSLRSLVRK